MKRAVGVALGTAVAVDGAAVGDGVPIPNVGAGVSVGVIVGVRVGVLDCVGVEVKLGVLVRVKLAVTLGSGTSVGAREGVGVDVSVFEGPTVSFSIAVTTLVGVALVGVAECERSAVGVSVAVGVMM